MKRIGFLINDIAEYKNLYLAYYKASKGKQEKQDVVEFAKNLENNLTVLQNQIITGNIVIGNYHYFTIHDPKERVICAASFQERVLHHAIMNICHSVFEKKLIHTTYATRPNKGIYKAIGLAKKSIIKYKYVAKLDVRKYFDSISHTVLKEMLTNMFKDSRLLEIFDRIINSYQVQVQKGIPIGNLTSQYFANYYLSKADHYAKEILKIPVYIRYMDDMVLFFNNKAELKTKTIEFKTYIKKILKLDLKPIQIYSQIQGVAFLGYKILPYNLRLNSNSKKRFIFKYNKYTSYLEKNIWTEQKYQQHILPLFAFLQQADTKSLRKNIIFEK